jgi:hypothetical protein
MGVEDEIELNHELVVVEDLYDGMVWDGIVETGGGKGDDGSGS